MRRLHILSFWICLLLSITQASAQQNITFTSLSTKDGLSSNTVSDILKDKYGLMWFATQDGLNKFDGTSFTVYRNQVGNEQSLQVNEILALHEDKAGNLWIGTGGGSLSLYDRQKDAFVNFPVSTSGNSIDHNVILHIGSDHLGRIWICHFRGINLLDPKTRLVTKFLAAPNKPFEKTTTYFFEDSQQRIWIGTQDGLYKSDSKSQQLIEVTGAAGRAITSVAEDKSGAIWVGTKSGLSVLPKGQSSFANYYHNRPGTFTLSGEAIDALALDQDDKLWVGTNSGIDIIDIRSAAITHLRSDPRDVQSLSSNTISAIYIDKQGIYWIGAYQGGISKYDRNLNIFNYVRSNPFDPQGLTAPIVTSFAESTGNTVFVGTDGGGLSLFNPQSNTFKKITLQGMPGSAVVLALKMTNRNQLLVGTYGDGIFSLDPASNRSQQIAIGDKGRGSNTIFCLETDRKGNTWVGTNGDGIDVLNSENKLVARYTPNPRQPTDILLPINGYIRDIMEDRNGNLWIATHGGGIAKLQPEQQKFTVFTTGESKLPADKVQCLYEDSRGAIWAGTLGGGLAVLNPGSAQFVVISEKEGLLNNNIYQIVGDPKGMLWVSTNKGLSSYDINSKKINNYTYHNGVQQNNFYHGSGLMTSNGYIYFGGLNGFNYFNPATLRKNTNKPTVLITDLKISNKSVSPSEDGPIKENISIAKEIDLDYKQNFALSFVGLSYTAPEQNQYAYKLEGLDKDWNYVGSSTTAAYTNLDPGNYVFHVRASNNDGVWNMEGTSIRISVHPPFWRTTYAYIAYALLIIGSLLYHRYRSIQKIRKQYQLAQQKTEEEQQQKEVARLRELDQLKIKFLTNLSHEFRTPISLILGPVDQLLSVENGRSANQLQIIKRNGKRLLNLVNQLLDFRKMEENELRLQTSPGDLVSFVKDVFESFKDLAERKKIAFGFSTNLEQFNTEFDHDKIERILFNLLSNAFKFTLPEGKIALSIDKSDKQAAGDFAWIEIRVKDSGIGIPEDKKEKIFDRFFQNPTASSILNQGTGLGLSITREFVRMHEGTVSVDSQVGKGSTFTVLLPFVPLPVSAISEPDEEMEVVEPVAPATSFAETTAEPVPDEALEIIEAAPVAESRQAVRNVEDKPSILLVEDNEDFRFYLKDNLRLQYKVIEAANGKEGWQRALADHPHLVVSDVNMPYMDGIELCRKLKADKRTNHIPVILLTALIAEEDQIRGLEIGANDYVTKPFNFEILHRKIKNLLDFNNRLKSTYTRQIKVISPEVEIQSDDELLLKKITIYLEENLTNSQLSVEELSKHLGMSRSSLYSKLLELTGETPVEYIRSVKLNKAIVLLEKSNMTIAEIAYSVGFSTPNYFAKSFKAKFNKLPSDYLAAKKKEGKRKDPEEPQ